MKITLTLEVDDPADVDADHDAGITTDAYDRLSDALADAGYSIVTGPDQVMEP